MADDMKIVLSLLDPIVTRTLLAGGIVAARTDTIYGLLARADDEVAVKRVYQIKDRDEQKSPIVLIADSTQLYDDVSGALQKLCNDRWPGPVSIIIPSVDAPLWLRRENDSIAYRSPDYDDMRQLIDTTGPLIAPSANPEAHEPALSVEEAIDYFGDLVDVYVDGGQVYDDRPSQLLRVRDDDTVERLR